MSINFYNPANTRVYTGLSTDTKPASPHVGDKFIETDTGNVSIYTNAWTKIGTIAAGVAAPGLTVTL